MRRFLMMFLMMLGLSSCDITATPCPEDNDGDGIPGSSFELLIGKTCPFALTDATDCDDTNPSVYPDAEELCDGLDNNCDLQVDEEVAREYYNDIDGDGYGNVDDYVETCEMPAGYVESAFDCDDSNPAVNPDAEDVCDGGVDNDCDPLTGESVMFVAYHDNDGDGYGQGALSLFNVCDDPASYSENDDDCNDSNSTTFPGAAETCGDIVDNNCDGNIDEGC